MTPELADRLAGEQVVWLTTLRPDGSPHVTPVWFVYLDGTWWLATNARSVKVRNLAVDGRVALALPDGRRPVVAEGVARLLREGFPADVVAMFATKYGWDVTRPEGTGAARVLVAVPVTRWLMSGSPQ